MTWAVSRLRALSGAYFALMALVLLSGCAGAMPWNDQNKAGITDILMKACPGSTIDAQICEFRVRDGKEQGGVSFEVDFGPDKGMSYAARDVMAFEGQRIRSDVEKAVAQVLGSVAPGLMDAIMAAIGVPVKSPPKPPGGPD